MCIVFGICKFSRLFKLFKLQLELSGRLQMYVCVSRSVLRIFSTTFQVILLKLCMCIGCYCDKIQTKTKSNIAISIDLSTKNWLSLKRIQILHWFFPSICPYYYCSDSIIHKSIEDNCLFKSIFYFIVYHLIAVLQ